MKEYQSASQIKSHSRCPLSWEFKYMSDAEPTKSDMAVMHLGTWVHEAIEDELKENWPVSIQEILAEGFISRFHRKRDPDLEEYLVERGVECCEVAAKYLIKEDPNILHVEPESYFTVNDSIGDIRMRSFVDVVTDGEIWDWKTGAVTDNNDKVKSYIPHEEKIQGAVYMGSYYDLVGKEPECIKFIYLREGRVRKVTPDDDTWNYMMQYSRQLENAKKDGDFPGRSGGHCFMCSYEGWCGTSPVGIGNTTFEQYDRSWA